MHDDANRKLYKCEVCDKTFTGKQSHKRHFESHNEIRETATCEICGKVVLQYKLKSHMRCHELVDDRNRCSICRKTFSDANLLNTHIDAHEKFPCQVCHKIFKRKRHLNRHSVTHRSDTAQYSCPICSKEFLHEELLQKHMKKHENTDKSQCPTCKKEFINLQQHMATHDPNRKLHSCQKCDKINRS